MDLDETADSSYGSEADDLYDENAAVRDVLGENKQLKKNFDNLKELHLQLTDGNESLQQKYNALYQERVEVERQYQQLCESWRLELEEKQKQFEEARGQIMQPRDLEVLRLKLLEEVEGPLKQKCHSLAKEAETGQEAYVRLRREYERLKNETSAMEGRQREREDELRLEHEAQLRELREEIVRLRSASVPRHEVEKKMEALKQEARNYELISGRLREEVAELRTEKEKAVVEKDSAFSDCEKKLFHLREREMSLSGQVESLLRKNRSLTKQLEDSEYNNQKQHAEVVRLTSEVNALSSQLKEAKRIQGSEKLRTEERLNELSRQMEIKKNQLSMELMEKGRKLAELELQSKERLFHAESDAAEKARLSTERNQAERSKLEAENRVLLGRLTAQEASSLREAEAALEDVTRANAEVAKYQEATDRAQRTADALLIDKERLRAELAESQAMLERSGRWPEEKRQMDSQVKAMHERQAQLEEEGKKLIDEARAKELQMMEYKQLWENEAAAHVRAMDEAKRAWALEKSLLVKKTTEHSRRGTEKVQHALQRNHQKMDRYKHTLGVLKEEKAELVLKVSELETRLSTMQLTGKGGPSSAKGMVTPSPQKPRAVMEILSDMQALKQKQHAYLMSV